MWDLVPDQGANSGLLHWQAGLLPLSHLGSPDANFTCHVNRMGKTRDLFKKIRDTKGTFHAKMGMIKDRNSMDLTETEAIKKR